MNTRGTKSNLTNRELHIRVRYWATGVLVWMSAFAVQQPANATVYTFTEIANSNQEFGTLSSSSGINESGEVVFFRNATDEADTGVFTGSGGPVKTIADATGPLDSFSSVAINDLGAVAFLARKDPGLTTFRPRVIVRADSGVFTVIAEEGVSAIRPLSNVSINNGGAVAFLGFDELNLNFVVAVGNGGPPLLITELGDFGNDSTATSMGVNATSLDIAFFRKTSPDILRRGNSVSRVTIADTNGSLFSKIRSFSLDDMGNVAFTAELDVGGEGVFIGNGISPTITSVVDSFGPFDTFSEVSISNSGIAFGAELDLGQGSGVYTGPNHLTNKVIEVGDSLAGYGSTVSTVNITSHALNDNGQLVVVTEFSNGTHRLLRADPLAFGIFIPIPPPTFPSQNADIVAALVGTDNALLSQIVQTPRTPGELVFDYLFATTTGELLVQLGDNTLANIAAPRVLSDGFETARIFLDPDLFRTLPPTVPLEFFLNGTLIESGVMLNNIAFDGLLNGDFQTGDLEGWETGGTQGSAIGVNIAPGSLVDIPEPTILLELLIDSPPVTLEVSGDVEIIAGAEVDVTPSYTQTSATLETILAVTHTGTLTGLFANVGEHLRDGLFVDSITYNANDITVNILQAAAGDLNGDRLVNAIDIQLILAANSFGNPAGGPYTWLQGDNNGDGLVDAIDIQNILAANLFGQDAYAALPASAAAVPEPSSFALALCCLLGLGGGRRRRRVV